MHLGRGIRSGDGWIQETRSEQAPFISNGPVGLHSRHPGRTRLRFGFQSEQEICDDAEYIENDYDLQDIRKEVISHDSMLRVALNFRLKKL